MHLVMNKVVPPLLVGGAVGYYVGKHPAETREHLQQAGDLLRGVAMDKVEHVRGHAPESTTMTTEAKIDEWGEESFPSSDPPGGWAGPAT